MNRWIGRHHLINDLFHRRLELSDFSLPPVLAHHHPLVELSSGW